MASMVKVSRWQVSPLVSEAAILVRVRGSDDSILAVGVVDVEIVAEVTETEIETETETDDLAVASQVVAQL